MTVKYIGTYREEYVSPEVEIFRMGSPERICAGSGPFSTDGTGIPGMEDNDW